MIFSAMACSVATFWQQVEVSTAPVGVRAAGSSRAPPCPAPTCRACPDVGGVVVDLVQHDPQPDGVQRADHRAELGDPAAAVGSSVGVRALRRHPVPRVVAPVEAVLAGHRGRRRPAAGRCPAAYDARSQSGVFCFAGSSGIEAMSNVGSRCTVFSPASASASRCLRAVAVVGERQVGAPMLGRHRLVVDREVPDVQLVDRRVDRLASSGDGVVRHSSRRERAGRRGRPPPSGSSSGSAPPSTGR